MEHNPSEEVFGTPKSLLRGMIGGSNTYPQNIWKARVIHQAKKNASNYVLVCRFSPTIHHKLILEQTNAGFGCWKVVCSNILGYLRISSFGE